jgi:hypothetical protein
MTRSLEYNEHFMPDRTPVTGRKYPGLLVEVKDDDTFDILVDPNAERAETVGRAIFAALSDDGEELPLGVQRELRLIGRDLATVYNPLHGGRPSEMTRIPGSAADAVVRGLGKLLADGELAKGNSHNAKIDQVQGELAGAMLDEVMMQLTEHTFQNDPDAQRVVRTDRI